MKGLLVVVRSLGAPPLASRMKLTGQVARGGWDKVVLGSLSRVVPLQRRRPLPSQPPPLPQSPQQPPLLVLRPRLLWLDFRNCSFKLAWLQPLLLRLFSQALLQPLVALVL